MAQDKIGLLYSELNMVKRDGSAAVVAVEHIEDIGTARCTVHEVVEVAVAMEIVVMIHNMVGVMVMVAQACTYKVAPGIVVFTAGMIPAEVAEERPKIHKNVNWVVLILVPEVQE